MSEQRIAANFIAEHNSGFENAQKSDYQALGEQLARRGIEIEKSLRKLQNILSLYPLGDRNGRYTLWPFPRSR